MHFLGHWARKLSWKDTAVEFRTSWDKVHDAVAYLVTWGLEHRGEMGQPELRDFLLREIYRAVRADAFSSHVCLNRTYKSKIETPGQEERRARRIRRDLFPVRVQSDGDFG